MLAQNSQIYILKSKLHIVMEISSFLNIGNCIFFSKPSKPIKTFPGARFSLQALGLQPLDGPTGLLGPYIYFIYFGSTGV
jgi:hypothetical protein